MGDLARDLVFYQMQQAPEHLRTLLRKGGPAAVWAWANQVETGFRQAPNLAGLDEAEVEMEFYRTWTPDAAEDPLSGQKKLTEAEIWRIMSATEEPMPPGLFEALTQD